MGVLDAQNPSSWSEIFGNSKHIILERAGGMQGRVEEFSESEGGSAHKAFSKHSQGINKAFTKHLCFRMIFGFWHTKHSQSIITITKFLTCLLRREHVGTFDLLVLDLNFNFYLRFLLLGFCSPG